MAADHYDDEVVCFAQQRGTHVEAAPHFVATGLELTQPNAAVRVRPAKHPGQFAQAGQQVSARACRQRGDLRGGATRLKDSHREIRQ